MSNNKALAAAGASIKNQKTQYKFMENETKQEIAKPEPKAELVLKETPEISAFGNSIAFDHAQRVAKMLSTSNLIPETYRGNIQNTMIALEMANRIGASPLQVMQNLYVIQGKPGWSSSFIIAAINACKRFSPLRFEMTGENPESDDYGCTAWAYDLATNDKLEGPKITWKMAKAEGWLSKTGSKWKTMPDLMFRYRAAAFFGRLYAPDILMGMQTAEEVTDITHNDAPEAEDLQFLFENKKTLLSEEELKNATRILDNKEQNSYSKLYKLLQSK